MAIDKNKQTVTNCLEDCKTCVHEHNCENILITTPIDNDNPDEESTTDDQA